MRIVATIGTEALGVPRAPSDVVQDAFAAENAGFRAAWCNHFSRHMDALTMLAAAAAVTSRVELGVGVIPTYPRHPVALAQAAATVQELAGGRLVLGVGVSHRVVIEAMHGLDYSSQLGHLREYLTILGALFTDGYCSFEGEHYRVQAVIQFPGTSPVPLIVGAVGPAMCRLGGELADGVNTWMAGPRYIEDVVAPKAAEGAGVSGRSSPRIVAGIPVALDPDQGRAREVAASTFAMYGMLPNYRRMMDRAGVEGPADVAITGDENTVRSGLQSFFDAGATDVWAVPFDTGNGTEETVEFLAALAG
ncbi:MAG: TIGR03564 family F420-dependent LLM class oxidoreductase [Actinomycetia bacterium]|nr:TIGR03564 family F420-dependent LLM class oxidoreductase [Actinomycetes bacterium]